GAADVDTDTDPIEIYTEPSDLEAVRKALDAAGVVVEDAESAMIPKQTTTVDADHVRQVLRLMDLLEDIEDVQRVTSNADIPEELMEEYAG
ncbi:MAG TPA: YebC/PmpR family DNA-binding transcriptional regulator, partial [Candidatus Limnocylindrales bacterium]